MEKLQQLFNDLEKSRFRSSFSLNEKELSYLKEKGLNKMDEHAREFINRRLKPANPRNDGKQTPYGKHPVFVAQHATATCCRSCLQKWHSIPKNKPLDDGEVEYILKVIRKWLVQQVSN